MRRYLGNSAGDCVDGTQITKEMLQRQLEEQKLMSALSMIFISTRNMGELIKSALRMAGEYLGVTRIVIGVPDFNKGVTRPGWSWSASPDLQPAPENDDIGTMILRSFPEYASGSAAPCVYCSDVENDERYSIMAKVNVHSFIWSPLYVSGKIWGILSIEDCTTPRVWSEGEIRLVSLVGEVITGAVERSVMEEKLVHLSSIVENSPQFICYLAPDGRLEYVNEGAAALSGYSSEEILAAGLSLCFDAETLANLTGLQADFEAAGDESRRKVVASLRDRNGDIHTLILYVFSVGGRSFGVIGLDVTEQARLQRQLVEARNQAEQSSSAKSEFLSRMSHEMRTPMNAIIGMSHIAATSPDLERKNYCLTRIDEASKHLLGIINDVLDMSKIEAGKLEMALTEFSLEKMIQRVTDVVIFRMEEKEIDFNVSFAPNLPLVIISDDQRLAQVVTNLFSNAIKFTPQNGAISLSVRLVEENSSGLCKVEFKVTDTGIGVSPENQKKLFQSFEQADGGISRKYGGTGLGLSISKRIVELLGGEIWIESEEGRGSSFIFYVMVLRGDESADPPAAPRFAKENLRVLVVDDSERSLKCFSSLAEGLGIVCDVAKSTEEACRVLDEEGERAFSLVFVDWHMPDGDGAERVRILKERHGRKNVVVMASGSEWGNIRTEAENAGAGAFLPKPFFPSNLVNCIEEYLGRTKVSDAQTEPEEALEGCFEGRRILLAEDVEINQEIVIALLEETRVDIEPVQNGLEAVEAFKKNPEKYDLILMDIHMPEMDGYQATRTIRSLGIPRAAEIPVVAMTANVFREDVERCLAAGMNDHIGKPIDINEIIKKLKHWLQRSE
ncbi:MAG: response regulator [Synergistaceae bacterium]|jgi:PAS domain S-box-containing protein|nr:response regulator [Synergistaceae bacterium]